LKVNLSKSKVYGLGVSSGAVEEFARVIKCSKGELTLTYLDLPIGIEARFLLGWDWEGEKWLGLNGILSLLLMIGESVVHGSKENNVEGWDGGRDRIDSIGEKVGDGASISFWNDVWVGDSKLCDRFSRLYHLESYKDVKVMGRGRWNGDSESSSLALGGTDDWITFKQTYSKLSIDIPCILYPVCDEALESLIMFRHDGGNFVDAFTTTNVFRHDDGNFVPLRSKVLWQAVL
ncbi:hypothetical protein Tco_0646718, partial [Tanacetum coccineum]